MAGLPDPAQPLVHVVGARPNFIKAAPVIAAIAARRIGQVLVHTGQHYDELLSDVFFRELGLPPPDIQLNVGPGSYGRQMGRLLGRLETTLADLKPSLVVLYGDVNSTLAAALTASQLHLPIAHVEAGLRSFDLSMPEEVNRRVTDILSDLLFATSPEALDNLAAEGIDMSRVHHVGNPMIDTLLSRLDRLPDRPRIEGLDPGRPYAVATVHRPANVDRRVDAARTVKALAGVARQLPVVLPLHPRGRRNLEAYGLAASPNLFVLPPLGYLEFLSLVRDAALVVTDSGGIQEETTVLGVPCLTLRPNTERPITISHGTNQLVSAETLSAAVAATLSSPKPPASARPPMWDGHAGERIADIISAFLSERRPARG